MARRPSPPKIQASRHLSVDDARAGIGRLIKRLEELDQFNADQMSTSSPPELSALSSAICRSLEKTFGENTSDYRRFAAAGSLEWHPSVITMGTPTPISAFRAGVKRNVERARALLKEAVKGLEEDIRESTDSVRDAFSNEAEQALTKKIFIVHGHDGEAREAVARFLTNIGLKPIILHEQANQGRTVIEKVEAEAGVAFAVVLLTPDDEGCKKGSKPEPRARQNVLLELGYFLGKLGRKHVCAFKKGEVEIPSDFAGVVWEPMDESGGWKQVLGRELDAFGYEVDWNKVMRF